jgi:ribosomal-protein-alanine N-acetyltransferase
MHVRIVGAEDIIEVTIIEKKCFKDPYPTSLFLDFFESARPGFLVVEEKERIIGYCLVHPDGEVMSIAVLSEYRRKGIGSKLLEKGLASLKQGRASAHIRASNTASISFFEKHGFEKKKRVKRYYPDGEDGWLLVKAL